MFTSLDKALIAFVMSLLYILENLLGVTVGSVTAEQIQHVLIAITPFLVYVIPNKRREP